MLLEINFKILFLTSIAVFSALLAEVAVATTTSTTVSRTTDSLISPYFNNTNIGSVSLTTNTPYTLAAGISTAYIGNMATDTATSLPTAMVGKLLQRNGTDGAPLYPLIDNYWQANLGGYDSTTNTNFNNVRNTYSIETGDQLVATINRTCGSNFTMLPKLDIKSYEVSYYALSYYEDSIVNSPNIGAVALQRWAISTDPNKAFTQNYVADWMLNIYLDQTHGGGNPTPVWSARSMPPPSATIVSGLSLLPVAQKNSPATGQTQFFITAPASGTVGYIITPLPPELYTNDPVVTPAPADSMDTSGQPYYWDLQKILAFRRSYELSQFDFNAIILKVTYEWQIDCVATSGP